LNLELTGYENLQQINGSPHGFHGSAWIDVDKSNAAKYPF